MERITMSIDEALAKAFDQMISDRGYTSRSEAMRDLLRREVEGHRQGRDPKTFCVASLSYVYDHHARNLAERLTETQHAHHDLVTATMHVHLDHDHCMENVMLKGPTAERARVRRPHAGRARRAPRAAQHHHRRGGRHPRQRARGSTTTTTATCT